MISTTLPDIENFDDRTPALKDNMVLFANSTTKYHYPKHNTPYLFIANFLGIGRYIANQRRIDVSDRYFYFLNNNDSLEIDFKENIPIQTLLILFKPEFVHDCFGHLLQSDERLLNSPQISKAEMTIPTVPFAFNTAILGKISLLSRSAHSNDAIEGLLIALMMDVAAQVSSTQTRMNNIQAVKRTTKEEIYRRIFQAIEIMSDSIYENKSLDRMAEEVCMNKFHFLANFKSITGVTPHQYSTQLKLQKAFELLRSKQYSVSEVCFALGFTSVGSFSSLFKSKFHIPPSKIPNSR